MKKIEIDFDETEENFYCPVTNEILCNEGYVGLSKATLLNFWGSDSDFDFANKTIEGMFNEYLNLLKDNLEECPFCRPNFEILAIKLLLKELEKENENLELYTLVFNNSTATNEYATLNFCIDMSYKPTNP